MQLDDADRVERQVREFLLLKLRFPLGVTRFLQQLHSQLNVSAMRENDDWRCKKVSYLL